MYDENRFKIILVRDQRADFFRGDTSPLNPPLGEPFPFPPNPLPVPAIPGRIANSSRQDPPEPIARCAWYK